MPRRRELKAIANGVLSSFISRNNDVSGYWGLGKLYRHALNHDISCIEIDLIQDCMHPAGEEFDPMVQFYAYMLRRLQARLGMPSLWLVEARLVITFGASSQPATKATWGQPFESELVIKDDLGRGWSVSLMGWCAPHDPEREIRSTRVRNL